MTAHEPPGGYERPFAVLARLFRGPATRDELIETAARAAPGRPRPPDERTIRRYLAGARSAGFVISRSQNSTYQLLSFPIVEDQGEDQPCR